MALQLQKYSVCVLKAQYALIALQRAIQHCACFAEKLSMLCPVQLGKKCKVLHCEPV